MAEIVLFHHAQGLTPGVAALAETLRHAGQIVHLPDLYDGQIFATLAEGIANAQSIGFPTLMQRGITAAAELPEALVYIGLSLGVVPAQYLAQSRADAKGAVLIGACIPLGEFGPAWPEGLPVVIHAMDADPIFVEEGDLAAARALVEATPGAELRLYPGTKHLFMDSSLPDYDAEATDRLMEDILAFLDER